MEIFGTLLTTIFALLVTLDRVTPAIAPLSANTKVPARSSTYGNDSIKTASRVIERVGSFLVP